MSTVADILSDKGSVVYVVLPGASVFQAIEKMVKENVGALVVLDGEEICGIVTERDYLKRVALEGRTSRTTSVAEIMSTVPVCVTPSTDVDECMHYMTERRIRHLPVLDDGRLAGIVSIGDVVKRLLGEQATHIRDLTAYIQGCA